jgi:hypothetical protein
MLLVSQRCFLVIAVFRGNRSAVSVFRPPADGEELRLLIAGSLNLHDTAQNPVMLAVRDAYKALMAEKSKLCPRPKSGSVVFCDMFGLRDFYNFGRYFTRHGKPLSGAEDDIVRALERNFGGVSRQEFNVIVSTFLSKVRECKGSDSVDNTLVNVKLRSVATTLFDALKDVETAKSDDMNENAVRFPLLIDETPDGSLIRLLYQCGTLGSHVKLYDLSQFRDDLNDITRSTMISDIKRCMINGDTALLVNTSAIHGSLYDVLNQHYSKIRKDDKVEFFANVAIGAYSRPCLVRPVSAVACSGIINDDVVPMLYARCQVHPKFRLIVHWQSWVKAPAPFYNRFEKYFLTVSSLWDDILSRLAEQIAPALKKCKGVIKNLVFRHFVPGSLVGFDPQNTIPSLLVSRMLELAQRHVVSRRLQVSDVFVLSLVSSVV